MSTLLEFGMSNRRSSEVSPEDPFSNWSECPEVAAALSVDFTVLYICKWDLTCAKVRSLTSMSSRTDFGVALSWPPKSSTA